MGQQGEGQGGRRAGAAQGGQGQAEAGRGRKGFQFARGDCKGLVQEGDQHRPLLWLASQAEQWRGGEGRGRLWSEWQGESESYGGSKGGDDGEAGHEQEEGQGGGRRRRWAGGRHRHHLLQEIC